MSHRDSLLPSIASIKPFIPTHKRGVRDFVSPTDEGHRGTVAIGFDSVIAGIQSMWQVAEVLWYTIHEKTPFFDDCVRTNPIKVSSFLVLRSHIYCNAT